MRVLGARRGRQQQWRGAVAEADVEGEDDSSQVVIACHGQPERRRERQLVLSHSGDVKALDLA